MTRKKKWLITLSLVSLLPLILTFMAVIAVITIISEANAIAAACAPLATAPGTAPTNLGTIEGPIGGPVKGSVGLAQANIPNRTSPAGFNRSMAAATSTHPDFVTLNEVSGRTLAQIEAAAPGYSAYREPTPDTGPGAEGQSMGNVVLWKKGWSLRNSGRVKLVDDDTTFYAGQPVTWDRYATWTLLQRDSDDAVISVISAHMPTNPAKYPAQHGTPSQSRADQYGAGMDILLQLRDSLGAHGPVLVGGDMNTHASAVDQSWSAAAKMQAAGYAWHAHALDYVFFPESQRVRLERGWTGPLQSDHQWVAARLAMNGAGPDGSEGTASPEGAAAIAATNTVPPVEAGEVKSRLMAMRFSSSYPTMTAQQAANAITIAQVARELGVSRKGLQIALATAIQESKLVNIDYGDRDSRGLFQQRPSAGWGTVAQITNPVLASRAFFGQATHTSNVGLLDIPGWEGMPLTEAASAVQRPAAEFRGEYAKWTTVTAEMVKVLGGDLPDVATEEANCPGAGGASITVGTLNILGAGHTGPGGRPGWPAWEQRLPGAMSAIENAGITIAGLQEVHAPQARALAERYSAKWGMYPAGDNAQNKVIWDRNSWTQTSAELVSIPYFGGAETGMPLVQLTGAQNSLYEGQSIWVWSVHNPADVHGQAAHLRREALAREQAKVEDLAETGAQTVILGDFNDFSDGPNRSHCVLTPTVTNAFGGTAAPCAPGQADANVDHIYGANLTWINARVDQSTKTNKIADHPLVVASTAGSGIAPMATGVVELATQIAWADGRRVCCGASVANPAYVAAKQKAMQISPDYLPDLYASCDRFVATVLKLTVDPGIPWGDSSAQNAYLNGSPKWKRRAGELQPGDVLSTAARGGSRGHILIYLGGGRVAQASYMSYVAKQNPQTFTPAGSGTYRSGGDSRPFQAFYFAGGS